MLSTSKVTIQLSQGEEAQCAPAIAPHLMHTPLDYKLINVRDTSTSESSIYFYVLGCAGNASQNQKDVAKLMDDIASGEKRKPKFIVILGDNFYDDGVENEFDPAFKEQFEDIYHLKKLAQIHDIPCFVILGNHDHYRRDEWLGRGFDDVRAIGQINYSRLVNGKKSEKLESMFASETLDLKELPMFTMPSAYYSATIEAEQKGEQNLEMYFIDSSTYVKDYLLSLTTQKDDPNNQANWLKSRAEQNPEAIKLLFLHHPRHSVDKRFLKSDADRYLTPTDIADLKKLGIDGNYNDMLDTILRLQKLEFSANIAAHTHALSYHYKDRLCQVTAGGGGANLKDRRNFAERDTTPCYSKKHGFVAVETNLKTKSITFDYHTTDRQDHLKFQNNSATPLKSSSIISKELSLLHQIVSYACNKHFDTLEAHYFNELAKFQFLAKDKLHVSSFSSDNLMNYINRYEVASFEETVNYITKQINNDKSAIPLKNYFNKALKKYANLDYENFIKNPLCILPNKELSEALLTEPEMPSLSMYMPNL